VGDIFDYERWVRTGLGSCPVTGFIISGVGNPACSFGMW